KNIRLPESLVNEVDKFVRSSGLYVNRQQFVESAIREKVERLTLYSVGNPGFVGSSLTDPSPSGNPGEGFLVRLKETFLVHIVAGIVRIDVPVHRPNLGESEEKIRAYVIRRAEIEGKSLTEKQIAVMTENLLDYQRHIIEGLNVLDRVNPRES
ncbi:MAG: ribbon-helix-helix domain-containing protein, partial [Candidatus Bathyarchaeota archaeon]|nr:ribbon-helix-helix domain-containing protein [Candidatus Bathyarchaeota archaeon]